MAILDKFLRKYHRRRFNTICRAVVDTAPAQLDASSNLAVLSQTYNADIYMYLIAAKTFAKHVRPAIFIIVDDGLSQENKQLIQKHLQKVQFVARTAVPNPSCPAGGTWERILTIADYSDQYYIVQLDSDTVTARAPEAVQDAIQTGKSFTLSTKMGREFISVQQAAQDAAQMQSTHIQVLGERALDKVPEWRNSRYIRGCAGFAGFARGELSRKALETFSTHMVAQLGAELWSSWGSEQLTSNFFVANSSKPLALPFEQFPYWAPDADLTEARLVHFIGDHRFTSGKYANFALDAVRALD